ncbi:MAG: YciI family protein [Cellulomonas sp.]|uniref:YciI family protein n=1 Tax=unclassified Cellulomonas TaxID=2620175 RepID=UPI0006527831|nr:MULTISPECIES: YciI family protein [unclassified Cellulomonas]KMM46799.1 hypothetical protein CWIS_03355 [Cellulomonas sp. A375-1]MCR6647503.1 YciI family protein [Cellulomonas sp.]MCR6703493.1 YciI family protein [Cellulomonas sp.]
MPMFAVQYTYDQRDDVRDVVRPRHRAYLAGLAESGALRGSGPYVGGSPGALLIFSADDEAALRALLEADPFHLEGLIAATEVREWNLVLGPWAG